MIIALHWDGGIHPINIFVSGSKLVVSENPLIDETSLKTYNIASYYRGKYLYLWITIQNEIIKIHLSGSRVISVTHPSLENNDANLQRISVTDSPFTIQSGLITKNIYDQNSDAFGDVKEYEISIRTFVGPS